MSALSGMDATIPYIAADPFLARCPTVSTHPPTRKHALRPTCATDTGSLRRLCCHLCVWVGGDAVDASAGPHLGVGDDAVGGGAQVGQKALRCAHVVGHNTAVHGGRQLLTL
jgi:hypothetical protein